MRFLTLFASILLLSGFLIAQQKYLVTPSSNFIPVGKYDNISDLVTKHSNKQTSAVSATCGTSFLFGYPRTLYNNTNGSFSNFGCYHKDVMGQWFVAPASGTIDSIYWYGYGTNGALESLVYIRIHRSIVSPDYGPGVPPHPAPCQSWGYWLNSTDNDNGIAAFIDDATDTTWYSTINPLQHGNVVPPTRPPFAEEIWGQGVGYGIIHRSGVNKFGLMETGLPCDLTVGDKFFISMKVNSLNQHQDETTGTRTEWSAWESAGPVSTDDENWPSRDWKFYEHDSGPSNCAGVSVNDVKKGWVARGPFADDTLYTALWNYWYLMTVTTNVPPIINTIYQGDPQNTFDTGDQVVTADIYDCDPPNPGSAGVDHAIIEWWKAPTTSTTTSADFVQQSDITGTWSGVGDSYEAIIPGQPAGTSVMYRWRAYDMATPQLNQFGPTHQYKVISWKNLYYLVDTTDVFTHKNIATTGISIDTSKFFIAPYTGAGTAPKDDGTAGPYSLGGPFIYFGDTMYYAWIGVNGAIALSKTADDTIDVNANGFATSSWDFPQRQHHHRADTVNTSRLPANFIAPFWADIVIGDTANQYGNIRYDNSTFPNEFVVEWDSVGAFFTDGAQVDIEAFRVVLNRSDGTIKFQYKHPGTRGLDTTALVGICMDSTELSGPEPSFIYINRNGAPFETRPRENWEITFTPGIQFWANEGWNLLSVAMDRSGMSMAKGDVYPNLVSDLFPYDNSYVPTATAPAIEGFWGKFGSRAYAAALGVTLLDKINTVNSGWNIIGTISQPVPIANVEESTPGMISSDFFPYKNGTYPIGEINLEPGRGYWVRVSSGGTLRLQPPTAMPKEVVRDYSQINKLTITDRNGNGQTFYLGEEELVNAAKMYQGELPPGSPEFSARFKSTGGAVQTYPAKLDEKQRYEYPINISAALYPITVKWEIVKPAGQKMGLSADGKYVTDMEGSGFVRVKSAKELAWKIGGGKFIPTSFALGQNYPNPFNPVTRFTVDVPRLTNVEIVVYDLLGRKIRTLASGEMEPGRYDDMRWDGTDGQGLTVPTGIYFIRMVADEFSAVQKVMLMK